MTIGGRDGKESVFGCATLQSDVYGKVINPLNRATHGGYISNAASSSTMGLRPNSSAKRIA